MLFLNMRGPKHPCFADSQAKHNSLSQTSCHGETDAR
jgi:hypothetical protein